MSQEQMSQEDFAVVKLAAAQRYKQRNIHPDTASYLFDRKMNKLAAGCDEPTPKAKVKAKAKIKVAQTNQPARVTAADAVGRGHGSKGAIKGVLPSIGAAIGPSKAVKGLKKLVPRGQTAAPAADKITKLAGALKNVLPPKQAAVKATKAKKLSEGLKKLVNG